MAEKHLVIVESPGKVKTIQQYLGQDYVVKSSIGHIRDLAKGDMAVDIAHAFRPEYAISEGKHKIVAELRKAVKSSDEVLLATDDDREGEAIAWHLAEVLGLPVEHTKRIVFHEITKKAIQQAIASPRTIDMALVDAQQARRILDRLVGYEISPILWQKVSNSARSAGRVQSVTVRLIVEREREIQDFKPTRAYKLRAQFLGSGGFMADLERELSTEEEARAFVELCRRAAFSVGEVEQKPALRKPAPPFTTSTLQQEASRKLHMNPARTMSVAQQLYQDGMITYMRTDSVNLSNDAIANLGAVVKSEFGEEYYQFRRYVTKTKGAQEAHEAIRPTDAARAVVNMDRDAQRLYDLIRKRALASQMADPRLLRTTVRVEGTGLPLAFVAKGEVIEFPGFLKLYMEGVDDEGADDKEVNLPQMIKGEAVKLEELRAQERYSKHPPRYSEAALVKKLEDLEIGRPSTYSSTIHTVIDRGYVENDSRPASTRKIWVLALKGEQIKEGYVDENYGAESRKLFPTDMGMVVCDYLMQKFPKLMQYDFTAKVEADFDEVASGEKDWTEMLAEFYGPFHERVEAAREAEGRQDTERVLGVDPKTGLEVLVRIARFGPVAQIGRGTEEDKPKYASLRKEQRLETITLEEALDLFRWPREIGEYEGLPLSVGPGRFGPYIKHGATYVSLDKGEDMEKVDQARAIELIVAKRADIAKRTLKIFEEDPDLVVMKGRFGPYLSYKGKMHRMPKDTAWESMGVEELMGFVKTTVRKNTSKKTSATRSTKSTGAKRSTTTRAKRGKKKDE